jgi:hypothetical protein
VDVDQPLKFSQEFNRRLFLRRSGIGLGAAAIAMLNGDLARANSLPRAAGATSHFPGKAKRVIYLFQSGAPSQFELLDYKPQLVDKQGEDLPESIRQGQRLTGMTANQTKFPVAPSIFKFARHGNAGTEISELLPFTARVVDDICVLRSVHTEAINHDPAMTFCQTGSQLAGRPSMGSWVAYGLGTANRDLPTFVVLTSRGTGRPNGQPLYDRLWGSGYLPSLYQGVKFRNGKEPVLYINDPAGFGRELRREMLDDLGRLNQARFEQTADPEIKTRIEQYELAFRMQAAVPELTDISDEPESVLNAYGPDVHKPGTYARNCLLARRMAERDVRFIQLYHMGWDQHDNLPDHVSKQCRDTDQPSAALVSDLKQRGLLDDTLVIWGGEFGRTVYSQGQLTAENYGRDHHPRCFSVWMAGGGIKPGITYGQTDDYGYNIVQDPVAVHDLNATILHCLGLDHRKLSIDHQGLRIRLTGVEEQSPVFDILA